jgi:hypothetical protein
MRPNRGVVWAIGIAAFVAFQALGLAVAPLLDVPREWCAIATLVVGAILLDRVWFAIGRRRGWFDAPSEPPGAPPTPQTDEPSEPHDRD